MDINEATTVYLLDQTAITALVCDRIYDGQFPEGTPLPAILVTRIAGTSNAHQRGAGSLQMARLQISSYGLNAASAAAVARQVRRAVAPETIAEGTPGFSGLQRDPANPAESLDVARALPVGDIQLKESPQDAGDRFPTHRALDFEIWYREVSLA